MCSHCRRHPPAVPTWPTQLDCFSKSRQAYLGTQSHAKKIIIGFEHLHESPCSQGRPLCLTKTALILQANKQLYQLLDCVLNVQEQGWVSALLVTPAICPLTFYLCASSCCSHRLCEHFQASVTYSVWELISLCRFLLNLRAFQMHLHGNFFSC